MNVSLEQLYTAYRKAKKEAFGDTNCAHGLKFGEYEQRLSRNLSRLRRTLNRAEPTWQTDLEFIGRATCIPKSVEAPEPPLGRPIHCQSSSPLEQWERQCATARATADFRPVIDATVDFMVVSALWVLDVGHLYDEKLDTRYAVGNRLRRWRPEPDSPVGTPGALNTESPDLFQPYHTAYGKWKAAGLRTMRRDLEEGHRIVAVTMDLQRFYHRVNAQFLLRDDYLEEIELELTENQRTFTQLLIDAFDTWNQAAHSEFRCGAMGLPVGLTASCVIANVLLQQFDRQIVSRLAPSYYARYVDDVFLVIRHAVPFEDGEGFLRWLGERLAPIASAVFPEDNEPQSDRPALQVNLPYGDGSDLFFVGKKQKIFQLEGRHGIDLIGPIEEQIRQQTSEHRNLPALPDTESRMAHRALLVTQDATLNADALRKADAVTLRRSGFAMLLGDVDAHVRDLEPGSWSALRRQFYDLAHRHLLTPTAFFDYNRYFPRIVGILVACGDWDDANRFVMEFRPLLRSLRNTCTSGNNRFRRTLTEACNTLAARMVEAVLQSVPQGSRSARDLLRRIRDTLSPNYGGPATISSISTACNRLLRLDWARSSYASHWLHNVGAPATPPPRPTQQLVRALLPFDAIRAFRQAAGLPIPHWPALAFPTRPIPLREITTHAPSLLRDWGQFSLVVRGLRGTWMPPHTGLSLTSDSNEGPDEIVVPNVTLWRPRVAITSMEVSDEEWAAAANGTPQLTLARYQKLNALLDKVATCRHECHPDYVVLPECALPRRWAMQMAARVLNRGVSLIAGLEYRSDTANPGLLHNEALVALRTTFPGLLRVPLPDAAEEAASVERASALGRQFWQVISSAISIIPPSPSFSPSRFLLWHPDMQRTDQHR